LVFVSVLFFGEKVAKVRLVSRKPFPVLHTLGKVRGMSIDQIAAEALRLPVKQRALLAESLWESLADPFESAGELDEARALALAQERDKQIEAGEVPPVSHADMMARLRQ
jgi:hypothetical protein